VQTKQSVGPQAHTVLAVGGAVFMAAAGIIHLVIATHHWSHSTAHGLSLVLIGLVEIAWGAVFLRARSVMTARLGILLAVGFIVLWAITRVTTAPFAHGGPEEVDTWGVISKLCEGLAAVLLVQPAMSVENAKVRWRAVAIVAAVAVFGAFASYGVAMAADPFVVGCGESAVHQHEGADHAEHAGHHSDHDHGQ